MNQWLKRHATLMTALLGAFALCVYIPVVSYYGSANSFPFTVQALVRGMAGPFVLATVVLALLMVYLDKLLFSRLRVKLAPSAVYVLLLVVGLWLEGFLLNRGLPQLTGQADLFSRTDRLVLSLAVWAAVIVVGVVFRKRISANIPAVLLGLFIILFAGIADAYLSREQKVEALWSAPEVLDRTAFSPRGNVLVLLLDAMSSAMAQEYLANNPDASRTLDGFVFFRNNLQTASNTQLSLPSILKGDMYRGGLMSAYQSDAFTAPDGLVQRLVREGYDFYASSTLPAFNAIIEPEAAASDSTEEEVDVTFNLYGQVFLRFAPYILKNAIANRVGYGVQSVRHEDLPDGNFSALPGRVEQHFDTLTYAVIRHAAGIRKSSRPTFHLHHFHGVHAPYSRDSAGEELAADERYTYRGLQEQNAWTWNQVEAVLAAMKSAEIYDAATIVILGDHGDRLHSKERAFAAYYDNAALFIKPPHGSGPLVVSPAPTSNLYVADFVYAITVDGASLDTLTANLPTRRQSYYSNNKQLDTLEGVSIPSLRVVESVAVDVAAEPATVLKLDSQYTLAALDTTPTLPLANPLHLVHMDMENGWGLLFLKAESSAVFQVKGSPGQTVDAKLRVFTSNPKGGPADFPPYTMRLTDTTSGKHQDFVITTPLQNVEFSDLELSENSTVEFAVSLEPFADDYRVRLTHFLLTSAVE